MSRITSHILQVAFATQKQEKNSKLSATKVCDSLVLKKLINYSFCQGLSLIQLCIDNKNSKLML